MRVAAMAPYERAWSNVELIKDCGLIPYLMYEEHGTESVMVSASPDPSVLKPGSYDACSSDLLSRYYPYYDLVKGEKMQFLPNGSAMSKQAYILMNAKNIDILLLRGPYPDNLLLPVLYKQLNPKGRVYCGLDMNIPWMRQIDWSNPVLSSYMSACDVLATSCTYTADIMTEELPWQVICMSNGSYQFNDRFEKYYTWEKRENTIITVGRLGTQQKATDLLLVAFASIASLVPDWKLELIGDIEDSFRPVIDEVFRKFPDVRDRIYIAGRITDRDELATRCRKAKIFALTSVVEGGTPNAVADAIAAGCAMCTTEVDAWEDITDSGKCGLHSPIGDVESFARNLLSMCTSDRLSEMSMDAYKRGQTFYNMSMITDRIYEMLTK